MHIVDMIFYWARTVPHRAAIIQSDAVMTYQDLASSIESIGEHIDHWNVDKADPVGVCLGNPIFQLVTSFALLRGGYSVAPVNARLFRHLAGGGIRTLILDGQVEIAAVRRNISFDPAWLIGPIHPSATRTHMRPIGSAGLIFFTSGTTGIPKKVVQPMAALEQRLRYPVICASDAHQKVLILPSLITEFGFNRACEVLNYGKTACFAPDSAAALPLINLFGIDVVVASVIQALALVEAKNANPGYRTESIKTIFVGGGKIEPEGIARIRTALCRNIIDDYGSTEAGNVARTPFDVLEDRPGVMPLPWVELEVVDEAGRPLPAGTEGLIRLRTPQLLENIKAAGPDDMLAVRDQWFYPGDVGSFEDGILNLAGRNSDVLNRGGVKVSGTRIEEILKEMPDISDAAACDVTGASGLQEIWVAVVSKGAVDADAMKQNLRKHSDVGVAPDEVVIVDQIPRGELGKIQRYRLRELMLGLRRRD